MGFVNQVGSVPRVYFDLLRLAPDYAKSLQKPIRRPGRRRPSTLIAFNAGFPRDCQQATRMAGVPNVELIGIDAAKHNVVDSLIRQGKFLALLQRLLAREDASL